MCLECEKARKFGNNPATHFSLLGKRRISNPWVGCSSHPGRAFAVARNRFRESRANGKATSHSHTTWILLSPMSRPKFCGPAYRRIKPRSINIEMLSMNDVVIDFGNMCLYIGDLIVLDSLLSSVSPPVKCRMSFLNGNESSATRGADFSTTGQSSFDRSAILR